MNSEVCSTVVKWLDWHPVKHDWQTAFSKHAESVREVHNAGLPYDFFVKSGGQNYFINVGICLLMCCWKLCCVPDFGDFCSWKSNFGEGMYVVNPFWKFLGFLSLLRPAWLHEKCWPVKWGIHQQSLAGTPLCLKGSCLVGVDLNYAVCLQILDSELFEHMHQHGDYTHFYFCYRWFLLDFKRGQRLFYTGGWGGVRMMDFTSLRKDVCACFTDWPLIVEYWCWLFCLNFSNRMGRVLNSKLRVPSCFLNKKLDGIFFWLFWSAILNLNVFKDSSVIRLGYKVMCCFSFSVFSFKIICRNWM